MPNLNKKLFVNFNEDENEEGIIENENWEEQEEESDEENNWGSEDYFETYEDLNDDEKDF